MYIKILGKHLRTCLECHQLCLKIPDPYDGEYLPDEEEDGVCSDCVEYSAAAVPDESFLDLLRRVENTDITEPTHDDFATGEV